MNRFLSYFSLVAVFGWLLFSYLPTGVLEQAQLAFPLAATPLLQWIAATILVGFVMIQLVLVRSAVSIGRANQNQAPRGQENLSDLSNNEFPSAGVPIRTTWEVLWTVLPLLMVVGVAAVGYRLWSGL